MHTVSVVMATFNGARFLEEQLHSLAAQTTPPSELVVSDDGSTDETVEIVEKFRESAPFPVVVRRNEHRVGYGENFLRALRHASGEYLAFCDQDDVWHPAKLRVALATLSRTGAELLVHPARVIDDDGTPVGAFTQGITGDRVHLPLQLGPWSVYYGCSMVFPARLTALVDPADRGRHTFEHEGLLSHDLWVYFLAMSLGRVVTENRPLVSYRRHQGNVTPSVLTRSLRAWTTSLGTAAQPGLRRGEIADDRAALLDRLSVSAGDRQTREAAERAAVYWRRIAAYEHTRLEMYLAGGTARRAGAYLGLARSGGYRAFDQGGLGGRLLVKDALAGVAGVRRRGAA